MTYMYIFSIVNRDVKTMNISFIVYNFIVVNVAFS
jgi:hypothetical protein